MPLPVDNLTKQSSAEEVREAITASVQQCMQEDGKEQQECVAMSIGIARRNVSDDIRRGLEEAQ
jgi:hypothetical protein|tara:strand:+ start:265 stop:456 length:192 start_codon:yes stop_codon:yes gene_type:complete